MKKILIALCLTIIFFIIIVKAEMKEIFLLYSIPALIIALIIFVISWIMKKKSIIRYDFFLIFIPFIVYILTALFTASIIGKSLGNLVELFYCGIIGGLILLPSVVIPTLYQERKTIVCLVSVAISITITVFIYCVVPMLSE